MTKLQLAQKRNYFKFVLSGMIKPVDLSVLTPAEIIMWRQLIRLRDNLIEGFDGNSRLNGLNVPEHRCWCGKAGKYDIPEDYPYITKAQKFCKKHFKNIKIN
jgi:hypothetical protein